MVSEHDACASKCAEARWTLESLGAKPLRFRDLNVERWRKLLRQAQKHLESSGPEEQSAQLCEVHQWQNELAAVAARALPDSSTVQTSPAPDRKDGQEKVRKVPRLWRVCLRCANIPSPNLESCPSRFAWATLCQDESEDIFQHAKLLTQSALAVRSLCQSSPSQGGHACCLPSQT